MAVGREITSKFLPMRPFFLIESYLSRKSRLFSAKFSEILIKFNQIVIKHAICAFKAVFCILSDFSSPDKEFIL